MNLVVDVNGNLELSEPDLFLAIERSAILGALAHDNRISADEALVACAVFMGRVLGERPPETAIKLLMALHRLSERMYQMYGNHEQPGYRQ